jgi:pimeloyl-ACP methyl ester carboxylesterase
MGQGFWFHPVEIGGFRGRYTVLGSAGNDPLLLLPSPLTCAEIYCSTAEELARSYRVYVVEMPGGGWSPPLSQPWTMADYASWLAAFIDASHLRGATVVGHSYAGGPAILLPALYPGRAGRVVIADGVGAGGPYSLGQIVAGRLVDTAEVEFKLAARGGHYVLSRALRDLVSFLRQSRDARRVDLTAHAAAVSVPVLLAWGAKDHTIPPRAARILAGALPHAEIFIFPKGSHCWLITHAREFAELIAAWVPRSENWERENASQRAVADAARTVTVAAGPVAVVPLAPGHVGVT